MPYPDRRVLVVDDRLEMAETIADGLSDLGFKATAVASSARAAELLETSKIDALVTDLRMPEVDGLELLARSQRLLPERPVIIMTAFGAIDTAIESIRRGAAHYVTKPFKLEELSIFLTRSFEQLDLKVEAARLKRALKTTEVERRVIGGSRAMKDVLDTLGRVAVADTPVLFLGETGSGKGLLAETLHALGPRSKGPYVAVNCAALPEPLLESELFGHVRGAFTGATSSARGLFVEASGGTLFLDEIGDMAPALQAKLLHVLERGAVRPVGGSQEITVDTRVVTATHRDLRERVRAGSFREDLLYRIDVVSVEVPPLRRRREDLPDLIAHFFALAKDKHKHARAERIAPDAMAAFLDHDWPGNVRELAHALERIVLLAREPEVTLADLPPMLRAGEASGLRFQGRIVPMREAQRRYAQWVFDQVGGHRSRAAERLDIDRKTLAKLLGTDEPTNGEN